MIKASTNRIYLDNAATTRVDPEVLEAMLPWLQENYCNPSSQYSYGREARLAVERARKEAASLLSVDPGSIVFTSGGTEANNMAIAGAVRQLGCDHLLYNPLEHHSVLHAIRHYARGSVTSGELPLQPDGHVDEAALEAELIGTRKAGKRCLVCVMQANNETGLMSAVPEIGALCGRYDAVYFADCVCTIGHYPLRLSALPIDLASAAAHKFHGPKGVGFLYARPGVEIGALLHGGAQERERRAGTENVAGIVGMVRALAISLRDYDADSPRIRHLRHRLLRGLQDRIPSARINSHHIYGLYSVLSVSFPRTAASENILLDLDLQNICVSGGSACSAGAASHVMAALGYGNEVTVRFSLGKYNSGGDIDRVLEVLEQTLTANAVARSE